MEQTVFMLFEFLTYISFNLLYVIIIIRFSYTIVKLHFKCTYAGISTVSSICTFKTNQYASTLRKTTVVSKQPICFLMLWFVVSCVIWVDTRGSEIFAFEDFIFKYDYKWSILLAIYLSYLLLLFLFLFFAMNLWKGGWIIKFCVNW